MPETEYMHICRDLFNRYNNNNSGGLDYEDFKYFTFDMERAGGAEESDMRRLSAEGSERTWRVMFSMFDQNGNGRISWDEAWAFLKENKP